MAFFDDRPNAVADELKAYERLITVRSVLAGLVIAAAVGAATGRIDIVGGLVLGFVFSVLKLRLQVRNLARFGAYAKVDGKKATGYWMGRGLINFATIAVGLLIAVLNPHVFNLLAVGAGLFLTNGVVVGSEIARATLERSRH